MAMMIRFRHNRVADAHQPGSLLSGPRIHLSVIFFLLLSLSVIGVVDLSGHPPFTAFGGPLTPDFRTHWGAGLIVLRGQSHHLYDPRFQQQAENEQAPSPDGKAFFPFISPPFVALFYAPFAALPYASAAALWALASIVATLLSLRLLWPLVPNLHQHRYRWVLLTALSSEPLFLVLVTGQDATLALLLFAAGLRLLLARRDLAAGTVLGLGIFKPQVFLLMPVLLLLQRRRHALLGWIASAISLAALSLLLIGVQGVPAYLKLLAWDSSAQGPDGPRLNWRMPTLFGWDHALHALLPRAVAGASTLLIGGIAVMLLLQLGRRALQPESDGRRLVGLFALSVLVSALIAPHLHLYDDVILLLPCLLLLNARAHSRRLRRRLVSLYLLLWLAELGGNVAQAGLHGPLPIMAAPWPVMPLIGLVMIAQESLGRGEAGCDEAASRSPEAAANPA